MPSSDSSVSDDGAEAENELPHNGVEVKGESSQGGVPELDEMEVEVEAEGQAAPVAGGDGPEVIVIDDDEPAAPTSAEKQMTAKEAQAQAQAEGLQLVRADSPSGFKGVSASKDKARLPWRARYFTNGPEKSQTYLGTFATKEGAALAYARYVGKEEVARLAAEGPAKRGPNPSKPAASKRALGVDGGPKVSTRQRLGGQQGMASPAVAGAAGDTPFQPSVGVRVQARHLATKRGSAVGTDWFAGEVTAVHDDGSCDVKYDDGDREEGVLRRFVRQETGASGEAEPKADAPSKPAATEPPAPRPAAPKPATSKLAVTKPDALPQGAKDALAAARREGLQLVPAHMNASGYKGVLHYPKNPNPWTASYHKEGKNTSLGFFATKEEAALTYARHIGKKEAARLTAEITQPERTMTAVEAKAQAQAEGLTLVPVNTADWSEKLTGPQTTKFRGVKRDGASNDRPFLATGRAYAYLGRCATPEAAALLFARHIGAKASAALAKCPRLSPKGASVLLKRLQASAAKPSGAISKKAAKSAAKSKASPKASSPATTQVSAAKGAAAVAPKPAVSKPGAKDAPEATYPERTMTTVEAKAQAQAEGLTLVLVNTADWAKPPTGSTKFRGVRHDISKKRPFVAFGPGQTLLGRCATIEAAALLYARHVGVKASAELAKFPRVSPKGASLLLQRLQASAAKPNSAISKKAKSTAAAKAGQKANKTAAPKPAAGKATGAAPTSMAQPMTAEQALAAAKREGLQLVASTESTSGFRNVTLDANNSGEGKWRSRCFVDGKAKSLGTFATKEEAALALARQMEVARRAKQPAQASTARPSGVIKKAAKSTAKAKAKDAPNLADKVNIALKELGQPTNGTFTEKYARLQTEIPYAP